MPFTVIKPRHPILVLLLSILSFYVLDTGIFRSGLYARVVSPETTAGKLMDMLYYERARPVDALRNVLLLGNSKMEWGFSVKTFEKLYPTARIRPIEGAVSGSTEQWWYYMLRDIDPMHDRYAAIVVPLSGYTASPRQEDFQNRYDNAQILAPILSLSAWPTFLRSFTDPTVKRRALLLAAFSSHDYGLDLQDLLLHPFKRLDLLRWRRTIGDRWMYDETGLAGSMEGLKLDPDSGRAVAYPPQFQEFKKRETDAQLIRPTPDQAAALTARNARFETEWVQHLADLYAGSRTKLLFISVPRWPFALPALAPIPGAPDVRDSVTLASNEAFLEDNQTSFLENPAYFADALHLNATGRRLFTERLGADLNRIVGAQ
jgi:hypothetical protein